MLRRLAVALGLVIGLAALWFFTRGEPEPTAPPEHPGTQADAPELEPPGEAPTGGAERWWFVGRVRRFRPGIRQVVVEAHWWPDRRSADSEPPSRIFSTDPIPLGEGSSEYRVEGTGAGHAVLFSRVGNELAPLHPFVQQTPYGVAPGKGIRISSRPGVVGAITARGRAMSTDDKPVAGAPLTITEPGTDRIAKVTTGPDGSFTAYGFQASALTFEHRGRTLSTYGHFDTSQRFRPAPEFADFEGRLESVATPVTLRMPRNPLLRIRGRLAGSSEDSACLPTWLRIRRLDAVRGEWGYNSYSPRTDTFRLTPGRYRIEARFPYAGNWEAETVPLALDKDMEYAFSLSPDEDCAVLEVGIEPGPPAGGDGLITVGAREFGSSQRTREVTVSTRRALLMLEPGTHRVWGAVRSGGEVWIAEDTTVRIDPGEHSRITLKAEKAGALCLAASPDRPPGSRWLDLTGPDGVFPRIYSYEPFRYTALDMDRMDPETYWVPPGVYGLSYRDRDPKTFPPLRLEIATGRTVVVVERPDGLHVRR